MGKGLYAAFVAALTIVSALALPTMASATVFEVDSVGDDSAVTPGVCLTLGNECTLRAAIEASNATPAADDTIGFDATVFEGQLADTIVLGGALPAIVDKVDIAGKRCATEAGIAGPCQGISGSGLTVEGADGAEIDGLAIAGGGVGITGGSEEVTIKGCWIGFNLDATSGGGGGIGIGLDSNKAQIGGEEPGEGNVVGNGTTGLSILGADETVVQGNYFGVDPSGIVEATNFRDILVLSDPVGGAEATGTLIGVKPGSEAATTIACDKGCNVVAGASLNGIDLAGNGIAREAAPVATHIAGNFIGLGTNGQPVGGSFAGVQAGEAKKTLIGGPEAGEANYFGGFNNYGVYDEGNTGLEVLGNLFGYNPKGAKVTPSNEAAVFSAPFDATEPPTIAGNTISMTGAVLIGSGIAGIELEGPGGLVTGNTIAGAMYGIRTHGDSSPLGSTIAGNTIKNSKTNGVLIENDHNQVRGNVVLRAAAAGIRIKSPDGLLAATENLIGGNVAADENEISDSIGPAVEIADLEASDNEVARNRGDENGGSFIALVPLAGEPLGPNRGIKPPTFASANQAGASGTGAKPGATVRVFRKSNVSKGEIKSFLAETQADSGGSWSVGYAAEIPVDTIVAATQTSNGASSELATAKSAAVVKPADGGAVTGGGGNPVADRTPPVVKIVKGPKARSINTTAKFKFSANEAGSSFQCKLDRHAFRPCESPQTYRHLKPGTHVFKVRAVDLAGNVGAASKRGFVVREAR